MLKEKNRGLRNSLIEQYFDIDATVVVLRVWSSIYRDRGSSSKHSFLQMLRLPLLYSISPTPRFILSLTEQQS